MNPFIFPAIGVDISDESFKYMRLRTRDKVQEIHFFGERAFQKGIVEAGEVVDAGKLASELSGVLRKYRARYPYLVLSLPEEKGFVRLIRIERIPYDEIRSALEFRLEEHIPYPPQDLVFDFKVLDSPEEDPKHMNIVIIAYPRGIVESYMNVVNKAGFIPIAFELESQAVARSVVPSWESEAVLVGDIGKTRTTFSIVFRRTVQFTATIKLGGRDIDNVLIESLQIKPEEAMEVKKGRGFDFSSEEVIKSLHPTLAVIKDEASRQIDFWENRSLPGQMPISKVILCGGDAHLRGLPEFFSRELSLPVERAKIWENIFDLNEYIPPINSHDTLFYATAFGLAIRSNEHFFEVS